ncbi:hypothetical protein BD560DRAFT_490031 [Blakeslea trispora]|nr:hypothetical protein BD560DRAFT_490031 [Blakeslea trispora]
MKFSAATLYTNLSELDHVLFQQGQSQLQQDMVEFVQVFDHPCHTHDAAMTFAQLTTCKTKLTVPSLDDTLNKTRQTSETLGQIRQIQPVQQSSPDKQAYLEQQQERRKQMEAELLKESDRLEEFYAKKTRDSIYHHLVGSTLK